MASESSEISSHASASQADGTAPPLSEAPATSLSAGAADSGLESEGSSPPAPLTPADATATRGRWPHAPDVAHVRSEIEQQIRAKPGRALLIALGVGYVIGRVLRRKRES